MTKNATQEVGVPIVPTIFSYLGMVACTLFTFMGVTYIFRGNIFVGGFVALLCLIILWVLANRLLTEKTTARRKPDNTTEYVLLGAYFVVFVVLFPFDFHFMEVEISQKENIIKAGMAKVNHVKDLIEKYNQFVKDSTERIRKNVEINTEELFRVANSNKKGFADNIRKTLGNKEEDFSSYLGNPNDKGAQEDLAKKLKKTTDLKIKQIQEACKKGNLDQVFKDSDEYRAGVESVFVGWNRLRIGQEYVSIDEHYASLLKHIQSNVSIFKHAPLVSSKVSMDDVSKSLSNATANSFLLITLILVLAHCCLLAPYLVTQRADGGTGLKRKTRQIKDDL